MKYQPLLAGAVLLLLLAHAGCEAPPGTEDPEPGTGLPTLARPPCRLPTAVGDTIWQDGVGLALTLADSTGMLPKNCFAEGEDIGFVFTLLNRTQANVGANLLVPSDALGPDGRHINHIRAANYFRVYRRGVEGEELVGVATDGAGSRSSFSISAKSNSDTRYIGYWLPYQFSTTTDNPRYGSGPVLFRPAQNRPLLPGDYVAEIEDEKRLHAFILDDLRYLPPIKFRLRVPFRVQAR
jgi:hypothetical protein